MALTGSGPLAKQVVPKISVGGVSLPSPPNPIKWVQDQWNQSFGSQASPVMAPSSRQPSGTSAYGATGGINTTTRRGAQQLANGVSVAANQAAYTNPFFAAPLTALNMFGVRTDLAPFQRLDQTGSPQRSTREITSRTGTAPVRPTSTPLPTPIVNQGLLNGIRNAMETMYGPQFSALDRQTQLLLMEQELKRRGLDDQLNSLGPDNELRKQRIDLSIDNAGREIGRVNQSADSTNWLAAQNLQRSLAGGQDWINSQGQLVNSQLGDLNVRAAGEARDIDYGNQRLALAFQALGLSRDDYVNAQNILNSRQQNVNTLTNLESADTQRAFASRKRDTYDDAVARGALTSTGARADLKDIDKGLRTAQDKLRENLRQSTEEIRGQRESARTQYGRSELDYQGTEAGIRNEQAGARDRIRLYESEGERMRTSYAYDTREKERQMWGDRDSTQNAITQTNINRDSTIDGLTTNIAQWGIDKQLLDQQLMDSAKRLGLEKQFLDLDYQTRTGQISQEKAALFAEMQRQILAYTPIVQQNPWILGINNQSSQSRQQPNRGPWRAV